MSDYSIEMAAERIVDPKTKRYFSEVYGCYTAGHYRSAVVMLWSVAVTDLLFKLDQLQNAYGDTTAQAILTEISCLRENNPKSPEWEAELVIKVASRTHLLDQADLSFLESLQNHRNLSAHPVMRSNDALFSPNKETVRAHIRNILDGVLTKPPIMSRKMFDTFIEDIEQVANIGGRSEEIKKYLEAKYFRYFSPATLTHIFKSLWRVTFKSTDAKCEANRGINAQALESVFSHYQNELTSLISAERDWFSEVTPIESTLHVMVAFFRSCYMVFPLLTDAVKVPIQSFANSSLENFFGCWFISEDPDTHMEKVIRRMDEPGSLYGDSFTHICTSLSTNDAIMKVYHIGIKLYCQSRSFDTADMRFQEFIKPYIQSFSKENFEAFLSGCETCFNYQAICRSRAAHDHKELQEVLNERFPDIDLEHYPAFKNSVA